MRLSHTSSDDWRLAAELVAEAALAESFEAFARTSARLTRSLLRGDLVIFNPVDKVGKVLSYWMDPDLSGELGVLFEPFQLFWHQHPWAQPGAWNRFARKAVIGVRSDQVSWRQFRQTGLWTEVYSHLFSRYQLGFGGPLDTETNWAMGVNRVTADFGPRERELCQFVQLRLGPLARAAYRRDRAKTTTDLLGGFLRDEHSAYALLTAEGDILDISPRARALLDGLTSNAPFEGARLPTTCVEVWAEIRRARTVARRTPFTVVPIPSGATALLVWLGREDTALLILQDAVPASPTSSTSPLTRRETEILGWLGHGKTNPEIATLLGISSRTVEKHCGNLFAKLGVESRFAASAFTR